MSNLEHWSVRGMRENCDPIKREYVRRMRREPTPAEMLLWSRLPHRRSSRYGATRRDLPQQFVEEVRLQVLFRRQVILLGWIVDFYSVALRLVVEVDGSAHDSPEARAYDARRQTILERDLGVRFVRLSNDEVLRSPERACWRCIRPW